MFSLQDIRWFSLPDAFISRPPISFFFLECESPSTIYFIRVKSLQSSPNYSTRLILVLFDILHLFFFSGGLNPCFCWLITFFSLGSNVSPCSFASRQFILLECSRNLRRFVCVRINSRLSPHSNISIVPVHHLSLQQSFPTVLSLQWALTHRSFPRILPDSSNYSGAIPKFFSKCDVRMDSINHMPTLRFTFKFFSLLAQPLCFSFSRSISVFWWCF